MINKNMVPRFAGGFSMMAFLGLPGTVSAEGFMLEEVIVTAQKREQSAQDVSVSITAYGSEQLNELGVNNPKDLGEFTPNLYVATTSGNVNPAFSIRGVGTRDFLSNGVAPVAIYVDEIFLPSNSMSGFSIFDIQQVEVLRGPQGTLFGRNTTGGAVSFATKKASQEFEAYINGGIGNYNSKKVEGAVGGAISDTWAMRVAAKAEKSDGFHENILTGDDVGGADTVSARMSFAWTPNDDINVSFNVHGGTDRSQNWPWTHVGLASPVPTASNSTLPGGLVYEGTCGDIQTQSLNYFQANCVDKIGYSDPNDDPFKGEYSQEAKVNIDAFGAAANVGWDLGSFTLSYIAGYESLDRAYGEEFDGGPFLLSDTYYQADFDAYSHELRLTSNEPYLDKTDWIVGLNYSTNEVISYDTYQNFDRTNHITIVDYEQETTSIGVFLHTETQLTENWKLIGGLRWTEDSVDFKGKNSFGEIQAGGVQDLFGEGSGLPIHWPLLYDADPTNDVAYEGQVWASIDDSIDTGEATGKIGLDYTPNEDLLIYGSVSRGYKGGGYVGFWLSLEEDYGPYDPEYVTAYEFGFKSTLLDGRMQLNGAAFLYDYTDYQLYGYNPNTFVFTIVNAGSMDISGVELEMSWLPMEGLTVQTGLGYTNSELTAEEFGVDSVNMPYAPEWNFSSLMRYEWPVGEALQASVQATYSYQSKVYFDELEAEAISQDGYGVYGARVALESQDGEWKASAWVKNASDKEYWQGIFRSGTGQVLSALPGAPRTFGLELEYYWK